MVKKEMWTSYLTLFFIFKKWDQKKLKMFLLMETYKPSLCRSSSVWRRFFQNCGNPSISKIWVISIEDACRLSTSTWNKHPLVVVLQRLCGKTSGGMNCHVKSFRWNSCVSVALWRIKLLLLPRVCCVVDGTAGAFCRWNFQRRCFVCGVFTVPLTSWMRLTLFFCS